MTLVPAAAQETAVSSVRVFSNALDATLTVDGSSVRGAATFLWPSGSKHALLAPAEQIGARFGARYLFQKWVDSKDLVLPGGNLVYVTADPAIASFQAVFSVEYELTLAFYSCGEQDQPCVSPAGRVYIDGVPYTAGARIWIPAGRTVTVQAVPNSGFVFAGWSNTAGQGVSAFSTSFDMNEPRTLSPRFVPARRVQILTEPAELTVLADRMSVKTPAMLDWGWESTHTLGVVSPQTDLTGNTWVFAGWSDGGAAVHAYTVTPGKMSDTIVARFVPGIRASFLTNPPGLKLSIDGRENWQSYHFSWAAGEKHHVAAPLEQKDAQGRTYVFRGWSDGLPAEHDVTLTDSDSGLRLTASYELLGRLSLTSDPSGLALRVDGQECKTPCIIDRLPGSEVRIAAPWSVELYDGARLTLASGVDFWSAEQTVVFTSAIKSYHAGYKLMHRLVMVADRPEAAAFRANPDSADGFYDAGSDVEITVEARAGYRFQRWEGDASGVYRSVWMRMAGPRYARALLEPEPYVPPTGARNAAGVTPEDAVTPGSIVSIHGMHLAPFTEAGPASPLAQSLAGAVVRLGDRLLPLMFVSPEQINLQLPYEVEPGAYKLILEAAGQTPLAVDLNVQRNAPGLFHEMIADEPVALATHADGSAVTAENPAKPGERIAIAGTGFGPYERAPLTGFATPPGSLYRCVDAVELWSGEETWEVEFAGAAEGLAGIDVVRFRVPAGGRATAGLKLRVNGKESNTVRLPVTD
jgi:uncharacterized protein (TIGR03437 family)